MKPAGRPSRAGLDMATFERKQRLVELLIDRVVVATRLGSYKSQEYCNFTKQ